MKKFFRSIREKLSLLIAKRPATIVLGGIILFNIIFITITASLIYFLPITIDDLGFWGTAYSVFTMILDPGCVDSIIEDIGQANLVLVIVCLIIILVGMVSFTGALIGYLTNWISDFIENSKNGTNKLHISDHTVIINWNNRASEIVNDLLYCSTRQKVVILVNQEKNKENIEKEIEERLSDTIQQENEKTKLQSLKLPKKNQKKYLRKHRLHNNLDIIIRIGDTYSSKQLKDISIEHAKTIIILGNDINNTLCKYDMLQRNEKNEKGNPQTIKTLIQVAELTSAESSDDNQKIIVEVEDNWTYALVQKIIKNKEHKGKCNIIAVQMNVILGQILSQFSLMPELNLAYNELFSNKGETFYAVEDRHRTESIREEANHKIRPETGPEKLERELFQAKDYLNKHSQALPLGSMDFDGKGYTYFATDDYNNIFKKSETNQNKINLDINHHYWLRKKHVIILGHNSKVKDIMNGFESFRSEWNKDNEEILDILVIDDERHLKQMNYYQDYNKYVKTCQAEIYEKEKIHDEIIRFIDNNKEDTSILILSDDNVLNDEIDSTALANLIYVQDIKKEKIETDPNYDLGRIDVMIELLNPRHHDIVRSFSVNNVVISNRYISKMITQLGEKPELFAFYNDILSYDEEGDTDYNSKEIYSKYANGFFNTLPEKTTADVLVRSIFESTSDPNLPKDEQNPTIMLGYVKPNQDIILFSGDLSKIEVEIEKEDKIIVFSAH